MASFVAILIPQNRQFLMPPKDKSKLTIYDVAQHAGVAISTVSRVLNDSPDVSERTREKVEQAIDDLKYHPNRTARSLAQQEFHSIAVALPSFTAPFQNELLKGIRAYMRTAGLDLLICDLGSSDLSSSLRSFLERGSVRGMIICELPLDAELAADLIGMHSGTVLIGNTWKDFDSFTWNDQSGIQLAVEHLVEQGHEYICMIRSAEDSDMQLHRLQGYRAGLQAAGLPFVESRLVAGNPRYHGGFSEEDGYDAMKTILRQHPEATAVVTSSDVQAIGAIAALNEARISVPKQMAIVGCDDIKTSRFIGLSSVDLSMQKIGYAAAERLHVRMNNGFQTPEQIVVEPKLHVRNSSDFKRNK